MTTKIAIHIFGMFFIYCVLLLLAITLSTTSVAPYLSGGLMIAEVIGIVTSKRKYLSEIDLSDSMISIKYFNRMLIGKKVAINRENLEYGYIYETNWWLGRLDLITFSNGNQNFTFVLVAKNIKDTVLKKLEIE